MYQDGCRAPTASPHREDSQMRTIYDGYVITPRPCQLTENKRWTTKILIGKHSWAGVSEKHCFDNRTFATKDEAIAHCLDFGRRIVDGEVEGCSVADL